MCPFHPVPTGVEMNLGSCASAPLPPHSTPAPHPPPPTHTEHGTEPCSSPKVVQGWDGKVAV